MTTNNISDDPGALQGGFNTQTQEDIALDFSVVTTGLYNVLVVLILVTAVLIPFAYAFFIRGPLLGLFDPTLSARAEIALGFLVMIVFGFFAIKELESFVNILHA